MDEPMIIERAEQPYVAIPAVVTMATIAAALPPLVPRVLGWSSAREIAPAGPPFCRFIVPDMDNELTIEVGIPIAEAVAVADDEPVTTGVLPAGRYVTALHVGDPSALITVTADLLAWAERAGLTWDVTGQRWGCRLEEYLTDPAEQPDPARWETRLAFKLA